MMKMMFPYLATSWDTDAFLSCSPLSLQVGLSHEEGMLLSDWVRRRLLFQSMTTCFTATHSLKITNSPNICDK